MNKPGKACIAMMCAFFVGSIASTVLAAAPDGNGMTLEQYELVFGLDLNDPAIAILDHDQDGVLNWQEWYKRTNPFIADSDEDGWPDGIDNEISRARLYFHPLFTDGDLLRGLWPAWLVRAFKVQGAWETGLGAWYVPAGTSGRLCLVVDRALLNADLELQLEFYDGPADAALFVDLVNEHEEVLASSELFGNLLEGSGEIVVKGLIIPLRDYPEARGIYLRGRGEIFVLGGALFVEKGAVGMGGGLEVPDNDIEQPVLEQSPTGHKVGRAIPGEPIKEAAARGAVSPALRASTVKAQSLGQFVQALMSDGDFIITRDALSGGGTRQTSPAFIMEDSFAQSSAIGFSFGSNIILHAGYQQAETERLELWNVSVTPPPYQAQIRRFNPALGETATFSYVLSTPARAVTVGVSNVLLVRTLLAQQLQSGGLQTVAWDGKNNASNLVSVGTYQFYLSATNYEGVGTNYQAGDVNEIRMEVDTNISVIKSVSDQPDPFFPAITNSTISYVTAAPAGVNDLNITVEIFAGILSGALVRRWNLNNQPLGSNAVVWDGTDSTGINAPDGLYAYSIRNRGGIAGRANTKTGAIMLIRTNTQAVSNADVEVRYSGPATIYITSASPVEASSALFAIKTAAPGQMLQSMIYRIEATPPTNFVPPALMAFKYNPAISGDIEQKLQIRRYNATNMAWEIVPVQFIDYANHQVLAEITSLSLFALFLGEDTTPPVVQIISPEAREYYQNAAIDIIYEVEDPVVGGISSGVTEVFVYLNGELYPYASIPPAALRLGENVLTVVAYDGAGNIGRATVIFTVILEARVTLKPEALNVNPGILTAFVSLPEGYPVGGITSATCNGALYERMMLNDDGTEMIVKFRRRDIEAALAQIGESLDVDFIVRGAWQDSAGNSYVFQGADSITKIIAR